MSAGTVPGWRVASSLTIRAEAEPTWCTWSSALGRSRMNGSSRGAGTPGAAEVMGSLNSLDKVVRQIGGGAAVGERRAVEQHRGRGVDPEVLRLLRVVDDI